MPHPDQPEQKTPSQAPVVRRMKIDHSRPVQGTQQAIDARQQAREHQKRVAEGQREMIKNPNAMRDGPVNPAFDHPYGKLQQNQLEKLAREIDFAHAAIVTNAPVNKIKESMFVNEMLPFLFDEIPEFVRNDPTSQMTPAKWIAAAGGPHAEFDVIDDATGNVLFRVPSFFTRDVYDNDVAAGKGRFNNMFSFAKQLSHMSPIRASAYTAEQFTNRGKSNDRTGVIEATQKRWNEIFKRYGRPQLFLNKETGKGELKNKSDASTGSTASSGGGSGDSGAPLDYNNDGFYF